MRILICIFQTKFLMQGNHALALPKYHNLSFNEATFMTKEACFVTSCDSNYFQGALALIASIRCFSDFPIVFLNAGISSSQEKELQSKVDKIIDITKLLNKFKQSKIVHTHLKVSALASLFAHYSGYNKHVYMDVDTLLLNNVDFVFNLLEEVDIVGVRAGIRNNLENSKIHIMRDEIEQISINTFCSLLPGLNLEGLCFNTGFIGINSSVLKSWETMYPEIFSYMEYCKLVDQSIFNLLLNSSSYSIKELHWSYNFAGISDSLYENASLFEVVQTTTHPKFLYKNIPINVAHFSGQPKPWNQDNTSPGLKVWRHFISLDDKANNEKIKSNTSSSKNDVENNCEYNAFKDYLDEYLQKSMLCDSALGIGLKSCNYLKLFKSTKINIICWELNSFYSQKLVNTNNYLNLKREMPNLLEQFSLVAAFEYLEFITSPVLGLININRLLKSSGSLLLNCKNLERWYSEILYFTPTNIDTKELSEKIIFTLLSGTGFKLIESGWNDYELWTIAEKMESFIDSKDIVNSVQITQSSIKKIIDYHYNKHHQVVIKQRNLFMLLKTMTIKFKKTLNPLQKLFKCI